MAKNRGLGKGLDALFEENENIKSNNEVMDINDIEPNKDQPRQYFKQEEIESLAQSIKEHGIIQPLIVRMIRSGEYQIVAGERRYRAARMLGLKDVPVKVMNVGDKEAMEIALIENLQRQDLNAIEEAKGYKSLIDEYNLTQEEVAKRVGKSRSAVANTLRLINLPDDVKEYIERGKLTNGQARALLSFKEEEKITAIAKEIIKDDLTVRQIERMAQKENKGNSSVANKKEAFKGNSFYKELEISLKEEIGRNVKIEPLGGGRGNITINFHNKEDLTDIAYRLANIKRRW